MLQCCNNHPSVMGCKMIPHAHNVLLQYWTKWMSEHSGKLKLACKVISNMHKNSIVVWSKMLSESKVASLNLQEVIATPWWLFSVIPSPWVGACKSYDKTQSGDECTMLKRCNINVDLLARPNKFIKISKLNSLKL